jgi:adenylyltransferase/sulfurtransferase
LEAEAGDLTTVLCGRDAVQVSPRGTTSLDLNALAERLSGAGEVKANEYLVRLRAGAYELTVFRDARAIVRGTDDPAVARSVYARYVGT